MNLFTARKPYFSGIYDTNCKKNAKFNEIWIAKEPKIV